MKRGVKKLIFTLVMFGTFGSLMAFTNFKHHGMHGCGDWQHGPFSNHDACMMHDKAHMDGHCMYPAEHPEAVKGANTAVVSDSVK